MKPESPLLRTKLHRPTVSGDLVRRQRLLDSLSRGLEQPLTLISAPAGYGKSVLVNQWLDTLELPIAWVSLDASDSDLKEFTSYLVEAVHRIAPQACAQTLAMLASPQQPPLSELAGELINELDAMDGPFLLVLDDYHRVEAASQVHELLRLILDHPPGPLRLVLITRQDPPLPIAALRVRSNLVELRLQDLQFARREVSEFLASAAGVEVGEGALTNLERQTEGWIAGLQLVAQSLSYHDDSDGFLRGLSGGIQQTQDYLLQEVLARRSPAERAWLLKTSVLDRFCADLCQAVCSEDGHCGAEALDGHLFVDFLVGSNLFTISLDSQGNWFRYHHLFQELLAEELRRHASPDDIADLHLRASRWMEAEGMTTEAIEQALLAGEDSRAADLVEQHRYAEFNLDRWYIVDRWLEMLPRQVKAQRAGLVLTQAWISYWRWELPRLEALIEEASTLLEGSDDGSVLKGELEFFRANVLFWGGDCRNAEGPLAEALVRVEPVGGIIQGNVEILLGLARTFSGHGRMAKAALEARVRSVAADETMLRSHLIAALIYIHIGLGELAPARFRSEQLRSLATESRMYNTAAWAPYFLACVRLHALELDGAIEGFSSAVHNPYVFEPRGAVDAFAGLALAQHFLGESESADKTLVRLVDFVRSRSAPEYASVAESCRARVDLLRGDIESAMARSAPLGDGTELPDLFTWVEVPAITRARVLVAEGAEESLVTAGKILERVFERGESWSLECQLIDTEVLQALVLEKQERPRKSLAKLRGAIARARPGGWIRPFVEAGPAIAAMLERLKVPPEEVPFVETVRSAVDPVVATRTVDARRQASRPDDGSPRLSSADDGAPDELTDRELDVLELLAQRLQNKEIASQLGISSHTVNYRLKHIYSKLAVGSRRQAVRVAMESGILDRTQLWGGRVS